MNRYHQNHPDPEVRTKYEDWKKAHDAYLARGGKLTAEQKAEKKADIETKKASAFMDALQNLAGKAGFRARQKATAKKTNIRKSGGQRGS